MKTPDFRFPLGDKRDGHSWIDRLIARRVSVMIWRRAAARYQFGGYEGKHYRLIDVNKYQVIHWILFSAGYLCCVADVMERCGIECLDKAPDGVVRVFHEERL